MPPPNTIRRRAELTSEMLLAPMERRLRHVRGVARRATELLPAVRGDEDLLIAAALLHDIGYASSIAHTGFHALDGARFLESEGWPALVVQLVAHHTGAWS